MNKNQNFNQEQKKGFLGFHKSSLRLIAALCTTATLASGVVYAADFNTTEANSNAQVQTADASSTEEKPTFTNIVITSCESAEDQDTDLVKMNTLLNKKDVAFMSIADKVIYAANQNNIPCGWPLESRIVSTEFNPTADPSISDGRKHEGMDISTRSQIIPIHATADGKVVTANFDSGYGYQVIIDHGNGYTTLYAHCNELFVSAGDVVNKGDAIATTGNTGWSTGIHLHYEIMLNGIHQNPRDYLE